MLPLTFLNEGEKAEIVEIKNSNCSVQVENMGIRTGKVLEVLKSNINGPMLVKVNDTKIALGRLMAMRIFVEKVLTNDER
jgi:ferrous iron transport protein A